MGQKDRETYLIAGAILVVAAVALFALFRILDPGGNIVGQAVDTSVVYAETVYPIETYAEGDTFSYAGATIHVDAADPDAATFTSDGLLAELSIGETVPWAGFTLTLMRADETHVGILLAENADVCGVVDEETPLCRGTSGCCDGTCVELPDCAGEPDGFIYTCGLRVMYCCDEQLTFSPDCSEHATVDLVAVTEGELEYGETAALNQFALFTDLLVSQKQSEGPYPTPTVSGELFSDVTLDSLDDRITFVFYEYQALVIIGSSLPPEKAILGTDIAQLQVQAVPGDQDPFAIDPFLLYSDDVIMQDLRQLFNLQLCNTAADCPTIDCAQPPCDQYACTGTGICNLPPGGPVQ